MSRPADGHGLDATQRARVEAWFPGGHEVVADLSWGLVETVVLHLRTHCGDVLLKAAGAGDGHLRREVAGYRGFVGPWVARGLAPRLLHADVGARVLATTLLPGRLATATASADDPAVHRQAGAALALLHDQGGRVDELFEARQVARCQELLAGRHRIASDAVGRLEAWLDAYPAPPTTLVPTHGVFSPRNWLVDDAGVLRVIDLGRFDHRPRSTDLCRLHARHWPSRPDLHAAFVEGYGDDPTRDAVWVSQRVREAVGTAVWAHRVGDEAFEAEGHAMIARLLDDLG